MALLHFLLPTGAGRAVEVVAEAVIAGFWQGVALAAATGLVLRLVPKTTASVRFLVWAAVFMVSAGMPLVHLYGGTGSSVAAPVSRVQVDTRWSYLLAGMWVCAAAIRLGMLAIQAVGLRAIWKRALPIAGLAFDELLANRRVQVCTSSEVDRPSVIGFFAPRILIPEFLLAQLTEVEFRHIVLHEAEHLRRRDDWVNLLQKIGLVLFPLNPALFWIDRRLSAEREIACDDGVLERTKTPRAYAASLTSIAERRLGLSLNRTMGALALGAIGTQRFPRRQSELARRIENILQRRPPMNSWVAGRLAAVLVIATVGVAAGIVRTPELVSFGRTESASIANTPAGPVAAQEGVQMRAMPQAAYRSVSVRVPVKTVPVKKPSVPRAERVETTAVSPLPQVEVKSLQPVRRQGQLMVLTTWEQPSGSQFDDDEVPVSRVVMKMPDGRFYVAPYAAVPTQAGWLIVQL